MGTRGGIWGLSSLEDGTLSWGPSWVCGVDGHEAEIWGGEFAAAPVGTLSLLMHSCCSCWKISADWEKEVVSAWLCLLGRKRLSSRAVLSGAREARTSWSTFCPEGRASSGIVLCSSSCCCSELLMELTCVERELHTNYGLIGWRWFQSRK